jgi:hypothetical protein
MPQPGESTAELMDWARRVALTLARHYRLRCHDRADVIGEAQLFALELLGSGTYDPVAFPGVPFQQWAYRRVRTRCRRFVESLRGGGTFRTARPENVVVCANLGDKADRLPDNREPDDEPDVVTNAGVPVDLKLAPDTGAKARMKARLTELSRGQ